MRRFSWMNIESWAISLSGCSNISVARENQPLETPRLLDALDSQMRRSEMSDPTQLVPLLKSMMDDERIPLIARNHAGKLVEKIEKEKSKK